MCVQPWKQSHNTSFFQDDQCTGQAGERVLMPSAVLPSAKGSVSSAESCELLRDSRGRGRRDCKVSCPPSFSPSLDSQLVAVGGSPITLRGTRSPLLPGSGTKAVTLQLRFYTVLRPVVPGWSGVTCSRQGSWTPPLGLGE